MEFNSTDLLYDASERRDIEGVKAGIAQKNNINKRKYRNTPLAICISRWLIQDMGAARFESDVVEIVTMLLAAGAKPNIASGVSEHRFFPLYLAVEAESEQLARLLLTYNADPNKLSNTFVDDADRDAQECTPLYVAVEIGNIALVQLLLYYKADPNLSGYSGPGKEEERTPLYVAVENEDIQLVQLLLAYQADPNIPAFMPLEDFGEEEVFKTSLIIAIEKENADIVRALLTVADPMQTDSSNIFPLALAVDVACKSGSDASVKILKDLLSHPKIHSNVERVHDNVTYTLQRAVWLSLYHAHNDKNTLGKCQAQIVEVLYALVQGGFCLHESGRLYSKTESEQEACIQTFFSELERQQGNDIAREAEGQFGDIMRKVTYPFITQMIDSAIMYKTRQEVELTQLVQCSLDPLLVTQCLLTEPEKQRQFLAKIKQLNGFELDTIYRLFFSLKAQQADFWTLKVVWDWGNRSKQAALLPNKRPKFLTLPAETIQQIGKELVRGPYKPSMFGAEFMPGAVVQKLDSVDTLDYVVPTHRLA